MVVLSDIPGDPGSQLPYQEFSPYYLDPIRLVVFLELELFSLEIQLGSGVCLGALPSLSS